MSQMVGGLTRQQVEFFNSPPAFDWVQEVKVGRGKEPFITAAMIEAIISAGAGMDGWNLEVLESKHEFLSPFAGKDKDNNAVTIYTVVGTAKVRVSITARDKDGFLLPGVIAKFVEGVDSHPQMCHSQGAVASLIGNAVKGAISKALRSASSRLGRVCGREVMRDRTGRDGKKQPWQDFTTNEWPAAPDLRYMGDTGTEGFSAAKVLRDAAAMGGDRFDYDEDGDAYDPHTGVVQPQAPAQPRRAPVEPPQSAPVQPRPATPAPAKQAPVTNATPPRTARPAWMSEEDEGRIARNEVMRDDGKPWVAEWIGPSGQKQRAFGGDPEKALAGIPVKMGMPSGHRITLRLRNPDDDETALVKWPASAGNDTAPTSAPDVDRSAALKALRSMWGDVREVPGPNQDRYIQVMRANGFGALNELRNASDEVVQSIYAAMIGSK